MTEWAKFRDRDPGSGDGAGGCGMPKLPLRRRVRAWTLLLMVSAILVGMTAGGALLAKKALRPGTPWEDTAYYLMIAGVLLAPLGLVAWTLVRAKIQTGRWARTPEERAAARVKRAAARGAAGVCGPGGCGARKVSWSKFAVAWASCAALDRERSRGERTAAWAVLAGYVLAMLAIVAFSVICFGAAFDDSNTAIEICVFVGLGLAMLVIPGLAVRRLVLAMGEGKVGATREEVEQLRAARTAWRQRQWQQPLRNKITTTLFAVLLYAVWVLHELHRGTRSHGSWVTSAAVYAPFLIYGIWVQFRRPKVNPGQSSGPEATPQN